MTLIAALVISLVLTAVLALKTPVLSLLSRAYIILFTGTALLVQIFLIYHGPQFRSVSSNPADPAVVTLAFLSHRCAP